MDKKIIVLLSSVFLVSSVGCSKIKQDVDLNNNINSSGLESESKSKQDEINFIKPGIWVSYKNQDKTDFLFYCFYTEDDYYRNLGYDGGGVNRSSDNGMGLAFNYKINNQDINIWFGSDDPDLAESGKIDFEDQNNFIITYDKYKDSPEKFEFISGNLEEFDYILSNQEISESFLNYYNLYSDTNINLDNQDFKNVIIKYNNKIYNVNRFTGILIDENNQEIDLLNRK